jgi:hypothetical protein
MAIKKRDLTMYVLTKPLREAMKQHGVNEESMMEVYSQIVFDKGGKAADRLRAFELFTRMLGLTAGESFNLNINTELAEVVEGLEEKLRQRGPGRPRKKKIAEIIDSETVSS